jgi:hypothetical protein
MSRISPTLEGFRVAFRQPSLTFAEIAWRWTIGATASALLAFALFEYLDTLPVTRGDLLLLRTRQPALVGQAIAHILRGSLTRVVTAGLLGSLAVISLWTLAASIGRTATVRALLRCFAERREALTKSQNIDTPARSGSLRTLLGLNFLRAALLLAAILALQAAAILTGFVSTAAHPRPGLAFVLLVPLATLVCLLGFALNWFLSLAAIFAVRNHANVFDALYAAVAFARERMGAVLAVSSWTGLAHFAIFIGASTVISMPLAFLQIAPWRLIVAVIIMMSLVYFALADWLYMARLAGYVCIVDMPEALLAPLPPAPPFRLPPAAEQFVTTPPIQNTIDRDEPILSDVSLPTEH